MSQSSIRSPRKPLPRRHPLVVCLASALFAHAAAASGAASRPTEGANLLVDNCNDSGAGSLREVIAGVASGDVVDLSALSCTGITLTSGAIVVGSAVGDLTIHGPGKKNLTISGNDSDRVFVHQGTGTLSISDLAISHGRGAESGGCIVANGNLVLDQITVSSCAAGSANIQSTRGGGIAVSGNATLSNSDFIGNTLDGNLLVRGGALAVGGTLSATDSHFTQNRAHSHLVNGGNMFGNIVEGGAIQALGATELVNSTISGNTAFSDSYEVFGGGISVGPRGNGAPASSLDISNTLISDNVVDSDCDVCAPQGGGAWVNANSRLHHMIVRDNAVGSAGNYGGGGGIRFSGSGNRVEIFDSTISGNRADSAGGGIIGPGIGVLSIARTRISGNSAGNLGGTNEGGGGILGFGSTLELIDSSITGNTAGADGGGVGLLFGDYAPSPSMIVNSTISGNQAREGGGFFIDGSHIRFSNSTIAFNTATFRGAGVSADSYTYVVQLQSTIIAGNLTNGAANNVWTYPKVVSGTNNLIPNAPGLPEQMPPDTIVLDPLLLPLAENGGPTPTHALGAGSPAIDTGNNALGLVFDQRGPNYLRQYGSAPDIGAFEQQPPSDVIFANGFED
jgi:hypothetical protein